MRKIVYGDWPNCYRLSNDMLDLVVATDVGPRIIRFGFVGQENEFAELKEMPGKNEYRLYGGHRLWHSPENIPRTYCPDNSPVKIEEHAEFSRLVQPVEATTGIQKEMDIRLPSDSPHVQVTHRLRNTNLWTVRLAAWAISMMAPGGVCIIPLPPRSLNLEDAFRLTPITLWGYTDMADPRWTWGRQYVMLHQDPGVPTPQKAGLAATDGWIAYARKEHLFVVRYDYFPAATYPDLGCCVETYANGEFLEVETLGPLCDLQPGATVEHTEHWFLFEDVPMPANDADVERFAALCRG